MARDRKRSKQRQQRRVRQGAGTRASPPVRENLPGQLDHASGPVDEFDAALVVGARPQPAAGEPALSPPGAEGSGADGEPGESEPPGADGPGADGEPGRPEPPAGGGGGARGGVPEEPQPEPEPEPEGGLAERVERAAGPSRRRSGHTLARAINFLRASWAELQRVQWPDRRQVAQATTVVLGFVVIAGAYLGLADFVAKKLVDAIL